MYIFLIVFVCEVAAFQSEDLNVGTVLFSPSDVRKKRWSATELGLLRARKQFQTVIPPPNMINPNDDFVNHLLKFFKASYASVKSEAKDPETDSIMNAALSDAIGGYLKAWVLPITKYGYYGGTVSQEDALKLFQFYEEIKKCLDTNGSSWRSPNANLLNSISIGIAPLRSTNTRGASSSCNSLAYFEKTDSGLAVPVPNVNWDGDAASMFVPLKNHSLVSLNSHNTDSLFKYYDAAKNCIESSELEDKGSFENRFQSWLTREVVPHLNDETLYPALGSVLCLVNKTRNLVDTVIDLYGQNSLQETIFARIPINLSSKKTMVIFAIFFLEIAWCIPMLCCLVRRRLKRNKPKNIYLYVKRDKDKNSKKWNCSDCTQCTPLETSSKSIICEYLRTESTKEVNEKCSNPCKSLNVMHKHQTKSCNIEAHYSNTSKHSMGTDIKSHSLQMSPPDKIKIINEKPIHIENNLPKTKMSAAEKRKSSVGEMCNCIPDRDNVNITDNKNDSYITVHELEPNKTVTILNQNENLVTDDDESIKTEETMKVESNITVKQACVTRNASVNEVKNIDAGTKKSEMDTGAHDRINIKAKCKHDYDVEKNTKNIMNVEADVTIKQSRKSTRKIKVKQSKPRGKVCKIASTAHIIEHSTTNVQDRKEIMNCQGTGVKLTSGKPYFEITIDRPRRQVSIGSPRRQSKIPKRAPNCCRAEAPNMSSKNAFQNTLGHNRKTFIPQPKRQKTLEDIFTKCDKPEEKLNKTL